MHSINNETLQYGYDINLAKNPLPFAKLMNDFQNNNYDITGILDEYNRVGNLTLQIIEKQTQLQARTNELSKLNQEIKSCEAMLSIHRKNLDTYQRLEVMKFGIKELEQLSLTVSEIVRDHYNPLRDHDNIENPVAFFMKDVEDNYYNKLKFEDKVNAKRTELSMINAQINYNRQNLKLQPFIGSNLLSLFQKGIDEQDIIEVSRIFNNNQSLWDLFVDESKGKGNTHDPNDNNNSHIVKEKRWRILVDELKKYGGLKAMVKKQEDRLYKLEKESSMLFYQAQALGTICHNYLNLINFINSSISHYRYCKEVIDRYYKEIEKYNKYKNNWIIIIVLFNNNTQEQSDKGKSMSKDKRHDRDRNFKKSNKA